MIYFVISEIAHTLWCVLATFLFKHNMLHWFTEERRRSCPESLSCYVGVEMLRGYIAQQAPLD
jgi:hypothetical protein